MKTVISRRYDRLQTTGKLVVFNEDKKVLELVTIELPDNGNQKNVSCIPEGTYKLSKIVRPNGDPAFLVHNVPGRTNILIHKGNYATGRKVDTEGCILPGVYWDDLNGDGALDVAESTMAMEKLLAVLPKESVLIII